MYVLLVCLAKLHATSRCKPYFKCTHTHIHTRLASVLPSLHTYMYAGKTVPEEDLKALLEEDMSEKALQEEKETEIMLDCNEKFNEVWLCFWYIQYDMQVEWCVLVYIQYVLTPYSSQ